jgi:hypothetical protein
MSSQISHSIQPTDINENEVSTELEALTVSQEYTSQIVKEDLIDSNSWKELPIASNCKLVILESDSAVTIKEGESGTEQAGVTFLFLKKNISSSFYVKAQDTAQISISWKSYGVED